MEFQGPYDAAYTTAQEYLTFPFAGFHHVNPLAAELLILLGLLLALLGSDYGLNITLLCWLGLARLVSSHGEVEWVVRVGSAVIVRVRPEDKDGNR